MNRIVLITLMTSFVYLISCQSEKVEPEVDCSVSGPTLSLVEKTDANCGAADGSATVAASGGEGTLTYSLTGFSDQESGVFEGLSAGNHTITVTDENECSESLNVSIANLEGVTISSVDVGDAGCKESKGTVTVSASDGEEPYQFKIDQGQFQSENTFTGLSAGSHTIVVKDDLDCEFTETVEVLSGISFNDHVSSIISTNCAVSGCHDGSAGKPDLRTFSGIQGKADRIKARTGDGSMPPSSSDKTLTQSEIDMIACWVDDGAPNN